MEPSDLLLRATECFERLQILYRVTGSMASSAYGEPRLTNDVDIVVRMRCEQIDALCAAFPEPDYYCSRLGVEDAIRQGSQFNILHPESGLKIDVMIASDSPFDLSRFSRGQRIKTSELQEAWFASPEDVILKKLVYFREGGSEKHLRDIVGVLKVQGEKIDRKYIEEWGKQLGVDNEWAMVLQRLTQSAK